MDLSEDAGTQAKTAQMVSIVILAALACLIRRRAAGPENAQIIH